MTAQEITAIYQTLGTLEVKLEQTPELGPEYLRDRLLECREKQDRATDLTLQVNKAYSAARQRLRALQAAVKHADGTTQAEQLRAEKDGAYDEGDALKLLRDAINVRRANLIRTASDIKLLDKIVEDKTRNPAPAKIPEKKPAEPLYPPKLNTAVSDVSAIPLATTPTKPKEPPQPVVRQILQDDEDIDLFLSSKED